MGPTQLADAGDTDPLLLLPSGEAVKIPADTFHMAYVIYFTLGFGYLLPWNAFITAVDYFSYLYPAVSVDRVFAIADTLTTLFFLVLIVLFLHRAAGSFARINLGLAMFVASMMAVPVIDAVYVRGRVGIYGGFSATVAAMTVAGLADALVQGGMIGSAGELPERYMQAVVAGTAASGEGILVFWVTKIKVEIFS